MLGSAVLDPLSVAPAVLGAVRSVARLGDLGVPGMLSTDCVAGDFCDATTGTCAARKPTGATCIDQANECQDGSYCNATTMMCVPQLDVGGACTDNVQCRTSNCPDGTCQPTPSVGTNSICGTG